jgi:nitric oxide synthase oxygenase domain/subunit
MILSVERSRRGFVLHVEDGTRELRVRSKHRRAVEHEFRELGVVVVDQHGCAIDQSQFDRELNPQFNRKIGPGLWGFLGTAFGPKWLSHRLHERYMRQSYDNARRE